MLRSISRTFSQRLYLRIWLAVVGGVAVLTLVVGWAWRTAAEQNALRIAPPAREVVLRDLQGRVVLQGTATRQPQHPSEGVLYQLQTTDGQTFELELEPRFQGRERMDRRERHERAAALRAPPPPQSLAFWTRPPFGFLWMLVLVGLAVALGVFPIIRRLMSRLEVLQRGVQRFGEGDLAARVPVQGHDEVADLSRQFNAAAGRIEALLRSHKSLLANASHELRSPLARIRMGMELMQDGVPSASARAEILRNIAELDQLVDEILLASRLDAREADVGSFEVVDLVGLAAEECARTGAELDAGNQPLEVHAVAKLLRRALRNLLENARRYGRSPDDGVTRVRIAALAQDPWVVLRVRDLGPGVPPDQLPLLTRPFFRGDSARTSATGSGLGLSIVVKMVENMGGTLQLANHPSGGLMATVRLRRADSGDAPGTAPSSV